MKKKVKRKVVKRFAKKKTKSSKRKHLTHVPKIRRVVRKKLSKKENDLIKKLERAAKKQGVSLFTYVRKGGSKKSKK